MGSWLSVYVSAFFYSLEFSSCRLKLSLDETHTTSTGHELLLPNKRHHHRGKLRYIHTVCAFSCISTVVHCDTPSSKRRPFGCIGLQSCKRVLYSGGPALATSCMLLTPDGFSAKGHTHSHTSRDVMAKLSLWRQVSLQDKMGPLSKPSLFCMLHNPSS